MRSEIKRLLFWFSIAIAVAALMDQLRRPSEERTWHGTALGVPYDFRKPSLRRFRDAWWNPNDPRLFTPRDFGVGWAVNLHRLKQIVLHGGETA
jgi:hypothetical protein